MTSKMRKKEHEFADAERAIEDATREAEAAKRESVEAKETERRLAERVGGGGGGGGGDDERRLALHRRETLEQRKDEPSWMRGQPEEARHTVLRAGELEAQRRAAADAFERDARDRGLGRRRTTEARLGTTEATPDPRGVPTREQLETRERERSEMRARLDELDAAGRDLSRLVGEMREVMDGRRQDPRGVPTREQFDERERELESARGRMDEGNAAAARLESHVEEMKRVMARAEGGGGDDHDHDHDVGGGETEADRRAAQLALEEATYVVREATRRADDIATAYAEKETALESLKREVAGGAGREYGSGSGDGEMSVRSAAFSDDEARRRQALVDAAEASFRARQAEERAEHLRASIQEKRGELEWMRGEIDRANTQMEPLRRAAAEAAERERAADVEAARLAEEARRAGGEGGGSDGALLERHPVDGMRQREAREALDKARDDVRWFKGELEAIAREASRACAERDAQIESLEFALAGVEATPLEARFNAEDTATASFRIRQIEERAYQMENQSAGERDLSGIREVLSMRGARRWPPRRRRSSRGRKPGAREEMAAGVGGGAEAAAAKAAVAEELAEGTRRAAAEAASERERNLKDELAAAVAAVIERGTAIEKLEATAADAEFASRESAHRHRVELIAATQAKTDAENAAAAAAAEAAHHVPATGERA